LYVYIAMLELPFDEYCVHPAGMVIVAARLLNPKATNMKSFCWVPAGVSITMLVPLSSDFVVKARSVIGVVFLTVAVTVQLGVVDGFSVS